MLAALFSGQGSQYVGMGQFLIREFQKARECFEEASDSLGYDMAQLCLEGPEDQLQLTENTQPAILTVSVAGFRVLQDLMDLKFHGSSGHSVGEYGALVTAGVIAFPKALELVRLRGKFMQEAVPQGQGAMVAVMGLEPEEVERLCQWACKQTGLSPLEPANYNSPQQTVISGQAELVRWVQENFIPEQIGCHGKKVRLIALKVSAPFHCSMMKKAEEKMHPILSEMDFHEPHFGIAQNFSGNFETHPPTLKKNLIAQISKPVRWVECIQTLIAQKVDQAVEFGPGKVLCGLVKKIDPEAIRVFNLNNLEDLKTFEADFNR